ncbi:hypothetical protein ThrDRAFT_00675 [Frankia casuarinae]|jgi:hypothetical protein|uniref:hypothetical protein n=1 Tax=Frankia TaxID=1854 RepID=UPI0002FF4549|nr:MULTISPECIES: hypothetical protein [Frankia]EYT93613.1 hypothetical protein ThrDRAFT_00675 [Frankia casuarinae]KDA43833.1 hypothetical protein BMG523Draft_01215 [Frankia sp. BMG5.23]KEZ37302.1 hypothetical protein CEDDRAFT_01253 [Frankia sp. CeD]OAA27281.1 hypothetical protein AAY23_102444 [Frankia casuarinae]
MVDHQPAGLTTWLGTRRHQVEKDKALLAGLWPGWKPAIRWGLAPDLAAAV